METDRTAQLHALKLRALVRDHLGREVAAMPEHAGSITGLVEGDTAWVLVNERHDRGLGPALLWSRRQGAQVLHVLTESDSGTLARRAALVAGTVHVWFVEGRSLLPAMPTPRPEHVAVPAEHEALRSVIVDGGAEPVVEHGVLSGEVCGLEVCVVTDGAHLEVGVGAHDREAFALVHTGLTPAEAVARAVAAVAPHRAPGAASHPYNRLAAHRLLRHRVLLDPATIGAAHLEPAPPPVPRRDVRDPAPCVAVGTADDGEAIVAVFSVGVDPDLVPFAADARDALHAGASLVLVVPDRDAPAVRALMAGMLPGEVRVVGVKP